MSEEKRGTNSLPQVMPDFDTDFQAPPPRPTPKRETRDTLTGGEPPPERTGGGGCWIIGILAVVSALVLISVGLLLPPVNLGERLFGAAYVMLSPDANAVSAGNFTLAVYPDDATNTPEFGVLLTTFPQATFMTGDSAAGASVSFAKNALPAGMTPVSDLYGIETQGTAPGAVALSITLPDAPMPIDDLDLYAYHPDTETWVFVPALMTGDTLVARVTEVPRYVMALTAAPVAPIIVAAIDVAQVLSDEVAGVASIIAPSGLQPLLTGMLTGSLAAGFTLDANYEVIPAIRNYVDPRATDPETVVAILGSADLRAAHVEQITGLAESGYDGVLIDYRDLPVEARAGLSLFVTELGARLDAAGLKLIVTVPAALNTAEGWDTGAYDWRVLGAAADYLQIILPPDPSAFVPGSDRLVEAMLRWAVDEVSRQKLLIGVSALSQRQVGDGFTALSLDQALSALGDVTIDVDLAPGGTIPPGTLVTASLNGYSALIGAESTSGQPYIDYQDDAGAVVGRVWLATGDAVRYRMSQTAAFALAGVGFDDLNDAGVAPGVLESVLGYKLGLPQEAQTLALALRWTIEGRAGVIGEVVTGLDENLIATIEAPDGNYAVNVEVVSADIPEGAVAGVTTQREGAPIAVFVPSPTPTPIPTSTPTPTPEPTQRVVVSAPSGGGQVAVQPGAGSIVTGQFEYGGHVNTTATNATGVMQSAGMTWMKVQLRYGPGMNPNAAASAISEAHGRGFKILLGVVGSPGDLAAGGADYVRGFASFLGGVASQGPDAIEVWNEPNIDREWPNGQIDGGQYAEMLRLAHEAIKGANRGVQVISAAPAPTGAESAYPGAVVNDDRWLRQFVDAGGLNYADCVGAHYNEGVVPATATSGDPRDNYYTRYFPGMLNTYWSIINGAKPICFTELGYLTPEGYPPLDPYFSWGANTTVAQQSTWLTQAVALASQSGRVRLLIIWNIDFTFYGPDPMAGFAVVRPGGTCPACNALASAR